MQQVALPAPSAFVQFPKKTNTLGSSITDTELTTSESPSGEIIAIAKWNIYDKGVVPDEENLDGPWWDDGPDTKEYAQELYRVYLQDRRKAIRNSGGMLCCESDLFACTRRKGFMIVLG